MLKIWVATALLVLSSLHVGCANRLPASQLSPRLQYQGFSAARPTTDEWFLNRDEQEPRTLLFGRKATEGGSTFFFTVQLFALEQEPNSDKDFAKLVEQWATTVTDPTRHEVLSYRATPTSLQGQYCLRYQLHVLDKKSFGIPGNVLNMHFEGLACRYPLWPKGVLDMYYSERGISEQMNPLLRAEGEDLLKGVTIETGVGPPAG